VIDSVFVRRFELGGCGLSVGVKDSIDVAGFATRVGSRALQDAPPATRHADVVESLLAGGCRIVGKTNLHELAYGVTGINAWTGTPTNPYFPDRVPGGSSSGSAVAVAAGLVEVGIGTDTGGSIRTPAACCGIYGLKPTYGRLSRRGVHPVASSLDCVGPLTRDMATMERTMSLLDGSFIAERSPRTALLGWVDVAAEPAVTGPLQAMLARCRIEITPVSLFGFREAFDAALVIIGAETWAAFGSLPRFDDIGADVRARLSAAKSISRAQIDAAENVRREFRTRVDALLERVDALALPTLPDWPMSLTAAQDQHAAIAMTLLVRPFNLSGHPALTIPLNAMPRMPIGLQLIGRMGGDAALCAIAKGILDDG
jgi:amidase